MQDRKEALEVRSKKMELNLSADKFQHHQNWQ